MAAVGSIRRTLLSCSSLSPRILSTAFRLNSSSSSTQTFARLSRRRLATSIARLPLELGSVQSLMPLHSVTASALLTSMLSSESGIWAWLSEGFAATL